MRKFYLGFFEPIVTMVLIAIGLIYLAINGVHNAADLLLALFMVAQIGSMLEESEDADGKNT